MSSELKVDITAAAGNPPPAVDRPSAAEAVESEPPTPKSVSGFSHAASVSALSTLQSAASAATCKHVVIDSGAIISGAKVDRFGPDCGYWTIPEVIAESKDKQARHFLDTFPYTIKTRAVSDEALSFVSAFARKTGDYFSLSSVDLKVLALTYMLEKEYHGFSNIRLEPVKSGAAAAAKAPSASASAASAAPQRPSSQSSGVWAKLSSVHPFNVDDLLFLSTDQFYKKLGVSPAPAPAPASEPSVSSPQPPASSTPAPQPSTTPSQPSDSKAPPAPTPSLTLPAPAAPPSQHSARRSATSERAGAEPQPTADDDGEGVWITPSNLKSFGMRTRPTGPSASTVACVTTDFSMQNVLLQMGLRLLSVNGMAVNSLKQWILKCHACNKTTPDMSKQFCDSCGNNTLIRVSVVVQADGSISVRGGTKKIFNKRGTKFSIPKPKGGREEKLMVMREDQLLRHAPQQVKRDKDRKMRERMESYDPFKDAIEFGYSKSGLVHGRQRDGQYSLDHLGRPRRNPNVPRKNTGNTKKRR